MGRGNSWSTDLENQNEFGDWAGRGNLEVDPVVESMKCQLGRPRAWDLTLRARGSHWGQIGKESSPA